MIPLRPALSFTDSWHTNWVVYEDPHCRTDCGHTPFGVCAARCAAKPEQPRTLVFATDLVVRRIAPIPDLWWTVSPAGLEALCNTATPSDRTTAVDCMVAHLMSLPKRRLACGGFIVSGAALEVIA
jgi:hypothetical protein